MKINKDISKYNFYIIKKVDDQTNKKRIQLLLLFLILFCVLFQVLFFLFAHLLLTP